MKQGRRKVKREMMEKWKNRVMLMSCCGVRKEIWKSRLPKQVSSDATKKKLGAIQFRKVKNLFKKCTNGKLNSFTCGFFVLFSVYMLYWIMWYTG